MMSRKILKQANMNWEMEVIEREDVPFGPPPMYYNYRCSQCNREYEFNEAIIDAAIWWAKYYGRYYEGVMPNLECYDCGQETLEYLKVRRRR